MLQVCPSLSIHCPPEQVEPVAHTRPQIPQFELFDNNDTQTPLHAVWLLPQQVLLEQLPFVH
jgi:hypothetical protein